MGEQSLRRLLIIGAKRCRQAGVAAGNSQQIVLEGTLARKPRMLVTVVLANKMARIVCGPSGEGGNYRAPAPVAV